MAVAIRTITRLQDADDVNVALGVGVDEYALTWDNDTAKFVLRAPFAGLLATGATTGATSQAQAFTNGIIGPSWKPSANSTTALQLQNAAGTSVLNVDTTNSRVGIGTSAPGALFHVSGAAIAPSDLFTVTNTTTGSFLAVVSFLAPNIQGGGNTGLHFGKSASTKNRGTLRYTHTADGSNNNRISIDFFDASNLLNILASGLVGIGTTAPGTLLHGLLTSTATNAVTNVVTIGHDTTGTAANGFGAGLLYQLESSTTAAQSAARIQALWNDATHASRKADLVLTAYDTAEREGLRIRGNGSAAAIGFLGAAPAARQAHVADPSGGATVDAEARSAINSILATLETFGFHATS